MQLRISGVPGVIPGVPFTSHDDCRVLDLGSDEVHSNHCCQVVHTHLVDAGIQLNFIEKSARIPEGIVHIRGGRLQKASLVKNPNSSSQLFLSVTKTETLSLGPDWSWVLLVPE